MTGFAAQFNHLFEELYQSVLQTEKRAFPDHRRLPLSASELCVLDGSPAPEAGTPSATWPLSWKWPAPPPAWR